MNRINWDQIRQHHPIATVVGQAIKLQKTGREYKGCCPFHAEKTPSFHVIPDKDFAHCFGCGWHGDVVDFIVAYQKCSKADAILMLTGESGLKPQSDEEKAQRIEILRQRDEREQAERDAATQKARDTWENADHLDPHHPYLVRKNALPHNCRQLVNGAIVVPIHDSSGEIISIQLIDDDGQKRFQYRAPVAGGRFNIGINMGRVIICEGFATGSSINQAVSDQVCVAFSCGNMEAVARDLHAAGRAIVLAPDKGMSAEKAAMLGQELGVPVVYPVDGISGTDFNDQAAELGIESVAETFRKGLRDFACLVEMRNKDMEEETGPVDLWSAPPIPQLPRGLLPPLIEQFALENSAQIGADAAGFAMSAIAACSAVITDRITLKPKVNENWTQSARIWVMLIGKPSTRKSTMLRQATGAIKKMDAAMLREGNKKLAEWQDGGGSKSGELRPPCPRLRIEDTTTEAAQEIMRDSPDGLLVLQDEMKGFFGRIEKYGGKGGGADKSFWLQTYEGGQYAVNRIGRGAYIIDNLSATILGGIQPGPLREILATADDDGLIQRFIPIMLGEAQKERDVPMSPVTEQFEALLESLRAMKPPSNFFGIQPLTLTPEARAVREELLSEHFDIVRHMEDYNSKLASHIAKAEGLFVRLCIIWHCVENVGEDALPGEVSEETARKVAAFMRRFLRRHAMAFYIGALGISMHDSVVKDVGAWVLAHGVTEMTEGDLQRNVRSYRAADPMQREEVIGNLEAFGWIEKADAKRRDAKAWKIAPNVHQMFAEKGAAERIRRQHVRAVIEEAVQQNG